MTSHNTVNDRNESVRDEMNRLRIHGMVQRVKLGL